MRQSAEHVTFQLPNERTRVTYLLDAIQNADPGLQAAMAQVRTDTDPATGRMNDFEATASYLLPYDPVSKKRAAGVKRGMSNISDANGTEADISSFKSSAKVTSGKSGVEFQKLAGTHNTGSGGAAKKPKNDSKQHKQWIASAVKAAIEKNKVDATVDDTAESDFKNYIWSLMASKQSTPKAAISAASVEVAKPTLQSILRKVTPKNANRG